MSDLPIGWDNRNNQMSEKDIKLGGDAANKFSSKGAYSDGSVGYKNSDEVKAFYMQQIDKELETAADQSTASSSVPMGWEDRQRHNELQAKQFGVFSSKPQQQQAPSPQVAATASMGATQLPPSPGQSSSSAEAGLVKVATTTLDTLGQCLEQNPVALSPEERAAFAAAMQRAMAAIAKCR